jgi:predicted phage terminase large subunit-like protein
MLAAPVIGSLNPLETFCLEYCSHMGKHPVPDVHRKLDAALYDRTITRLAIEMARGMAKTTKASIMYALYEICTGDYDDIQIISRVGGPKGTATVIMNKIKREIDGNDLLRYDYGLKITERHKEHITVKRIDGKIISVSSRGKRSAIRGSRGLVIIDDPQNKDDVKSATVLTRDEDWFFEDVYPVVLENQRLIFIGTTISPLSLLSKVKKLGRFTVLEFPVDDPVGSFNSVWPEQYSREYLIAQCEDMTLDRFNSEYRCMPRVSGNPVFTSEQLRYYEAASEQFERIRRDGLFIVTAGDGAYSTKKSADYTAIMTVGATMTGRPDIYVRAAERGQWSVKQAAEKVMAVRDTYQPNITFVESTCNPPQKDAWVEEILDRERFYNVSCNLRWKKPTTDKLNRAYMVQSLFNEHRVFFDRSDKAQRELINEILMFTGEQTFPDDQVDALVYALLEVKAWAGNKPESTGGGKVKPKGKANPVTGYIT